MPPRASSTALDDDPRNALALNEYGRFLFDNGRVEQGLELINAALEIEPYAVLVLWDKCHANAYLQRVEVSLAACARIQEIEPDSPLGWYGWGLAYIFSGDIARGVKNFSEAIERDPGDYEMIAGMTRFWVSLGDADQAEQWLTRAEATGAGQPIPIWSRLALLKYREQHDLARDLASKALARNLYFVRSWHLNWHERVNTRPHSPPTVKVFRGLSKRNWYCRPTWKPWRVT